MTVKDLKERLELLIEDGKEDYTIYVLGFVLIEILLIFLLTI